MRNTQNEELMRLGKLEFAAMNNPIRRLVQKHLEFKTFCNFLESHDIDLTNTIIMDAGCGSGYSTELIINKFKPAGVIAFDLMPEQIALAKRRHLSVDFTIGDVTKLQHPITVVMLYLFLVFCITFRSGRRRSVKPAGY